MLYLTFVGVQPPSCLLPFGPVQTWLCNCLAPGPCIPRAAVPTIEWMKQFYIVSDNEISIKL